MITYSLKLVSTILVHIIFSLLFFYGFLFMGSSYLFNGDVTHGFGSYLLVMHSSLAVISNTCLYLYLVLVFLSFVLLYFYSEIVRMINNSSIQSSSVNTDAVITPLRIFSVSSVLSYLTTPLVLCWYWICIYSTMGTTLFLCTGIVWGDYSWGVPFSLEYRFISLIFLIILYLFTVVTITTLGCTLVSHPNYNIWLYTWFILFVFTFLFNHYHILADVVDSSFFRARVELHQSDQSLHFFMLSVSGYYIFIIFSFLMYYIFILVYSLCYSFFRSGVLYSSILNAYDSNIFVNFIL